MANVLGGSDAVIIENSNLCEDWRRGYVSLIPQNAPQHVPVGVQKFADKDALENVKTAKDLACVDVVICTRKPDGGRAVLLSKRKVTDPFGGYWWIQGGSLGAYQDILTFIAGRAEKECGVPVAPQALVGVYRTSASDFVQSTLQPCYATFVPYEAIATKMSTDANHDSVRLFGFGDLDSIPDAEQHWYPLRVASIALAAMP